MSISFLVLAVGGNLVQISGSFFGATIGPMLGLFVLGALLPWANWKVSHFHEINLLSNLM